MERDMGILEDGALRDGELLSARPALEQPRPRLRPRFRGQPVGVRRLTERTDRAIGPAHLFKERPRGGFIGEVLGEIHEIHALNMRLFFGFVKGTIAKQMYVLLIVLSIALAGAVRPV